MWKRLLLSATLFSLYHFQAFEIDHSVDLYTRGGQLFFIQDPFFPTSVEVPAVTYNTDNFTIELLNITVSTNLTTFGKQFAPSVLMGKLTVSSTGSNPKAMNVSYDYQCTLKNGTQVNGKALTTASTNPLTYTVSWDFNATTSAPSMSYELSSFKFLVDVDNTKNCTPPKTDISDHISSQLETVVSPLFENVPKRLAAKNPWVNNFTWTAPELDGSSSTYKLNLTKDTVTAPFAATMPIQFKYKYQVIYVPPAQERQMLEQTNLPLPGSLNEDLAEHFTVIMDAALIYNITGSTVASKVANGLTVDWQNKPSNLSFPFPAMELRQMYLINPTKTPLNEARDNMTFVCTVTPPASYMIITSLQYTLTASCVINRVDTSGASTQLWTDTFSVTASAAPVTNNVTTCSTGKYYLESSLYPLASLTTSDTTTGETLDTKVLVGFQELAYATFIQYWQEKGVMPNLVAECFNPVFGAAVRAPSIKVDFFGVHLSFAADLS